MMNSSFGWVLAGVGAYGVVHSILAAHTVKGWVERTWGAKARRFYRLFYAFFATLSLLLLLGLVVGLPDQMLYTIPIPWVLLTLGLQGLAGWGLLGAVAPNRMPGNLSA